MQHQFPEWQLTEQNRLITQHSNGINKKIYVGLKYLFVAFGRNHETL